MKHRMLNAADVLVDSALAEPIAGDLRVERRLGIVRVGVAIEVPGGVDERVHGIGLAPRGAATLGTSRV